MSSKFKILSIDGGGLRGVVPILMLMELERKTGKKVHDMFDMFAGTSTGGLITCALTVSDNGSNPKNQLSDILSIYVDRGKDIFPQKSGLGRLWGNITKYKRPAFSADGLDSVLNEMLGQTRILNCIKPIFVVSYDMNFDEPLFFKTRRALEPSLDENALLHDVCRATSAGPTYLPAYDFNFGGKKRIAIDGGVFMNNPSIGVITEVIKYRKPLQPSDICMLSLGTGHYQENYGSKGIEKWGELDWVKPISDVMMQGVNQANDYTADELVPDDQYLRLNIVIDSDNHADMADSSDETRDYLLNNTHAYLAQQNIQNNLDKFIKAAGL